jgi:hypothetical protein
MRKGALPTSSPPQGTGFDVLRDEQGRGYIFVPNSSLFTVLTVLISV